MAFNMEYERKIKVLYENMPKRMYTHMGEVEYTGFFTYEKLSLKEALEHEKNPLPEGLEWGRKWEYGWFFAEITIPKECEGKRVGFVASKRRICESKEAAYIDGEGIVYVNGKIYGAVDREHMIITLSQNAKAGEKYQIAMELYAGHSGSDNLMRRDHFMVVIPEENITEFAEDITQKTVKNGSFGVFYDEVFKLWSDIEVLDDLRKSLDENSLRRAQIDKALKKTLNILDIELPFEEFLAVVKEGREILKPLFECKNSETTPTMYSIGHSHLDLEWLWTRNETRRKTVRTLGNQLQLIKEYPEYKYIQSQPWILNTVKNEYPEFYEEVKQAVKDGKIVVEGGAWVEPDTNIPSGESLIRQFITGKKFLKEEFGVDSKIFWLPDSFGVSGTLPQILKGCGIDYFMSAKVTWLYNGGDALGHNTFSWRGIDDSEVLAHIIQGYEVYMTPSAVKEVWNRNHEKEDVPAELVIYGYGDGGGGATRAHVERAVREKNLEGMPKVEHKSPVEFFEFIENECDIKKTFVGELYFAAHRGTYTSQAKTKLLNRKSEFSLREAEMWSTLFGENTKSQTDALWKKVLFNQFHDIIPGSAITASYEFAEKDYEEVLEKVSAVTDNTLAKVLDKKSDKITVFNSLSWSRKAYIELPEGYTSVEVYETEQIGDKVIAYVDVPGLGFKSYKLGKAEAGKAKAGNSPVLENDFIRAEFNKCGELISLINKETGMEFLKGASNKFRMYQDLPAFCDAWDIDSCYEDMEIELSGDTEVIKEFEGKLYSSIVIKKKLHNSEIFQRVILRKDSKRLDFETEVDWKESHKLLKVDFNTNIHSEELLSEIQFGHVKRPTHKNRQYDADRFEVWQHKWSALCEGKRGVALLNDCKYGISADESRMSLTLLKAAKDPALNADVGLQKFTYSVMPFNENICDSDVIKEAYELNSPVLVKEGFAEERTFMNVSEKNIIIDTLKQAEDGSGDIIIRMYEASNTYTNCKLAIGFDVKNAYITNMLEENQKEVDVKDNEISLEFKGFEIVTVRICL